MSVTKNISAKTRAFFPDVGLTIETADQSIDVEFTVISVTINADFSAAARVKTRIDSSEDTGEISVQFTYSGRGDPIAEAEAALKKFD